jgi:8-oxo-dGTP diphosphatase
MMSEIEHMPEADKTAKKVAVAIAILHQDGKFLMQLRDNIPGIWYPGFWGFFGGHVEAGETPEVAVVREVMEEISYAMPSPEFFTISESDEVIRHVFHAPLTVPLSELVLSEGWDFDLVTVEELKQGDRFSVKANQIRPIGPPHAEILLKFAAEYF